MHLTQGPGFICLSPFFASLSLLHADCAMQIVSDRDKATRAAALGTLELVYMSEGQAIWSMLGRLSDQQQSLLEERFKYTDKQVTPASFPCTVAFDRAAMCLAEASIGHAWRKGTNMVRADGSLCRQPAMVWR